MNPRITIVEMKFGSHLYGLNTPLSDIDYKGIFIPSTEEMLLGRIPKTLSFNTKKDQNAKNTTDDVDRELYSIQYFFELAKKGETVALDMLHAPPHAFIGEDCAWEWSYIRSKRHLFNTKTLSSLVGYARTQAAKYGVKGSRLADAKRVLECLLQHPKKKIHEVISILPVGEHCGPECPSGMYLMCGKSMTLTATTDHYVPMVEGFIKKFGERAKQAETNEGIDWKAISHAFRAGFQVRDILKYGDFTYPLKETDYLLQVKSGSLHYKDVGPALDALLDELDEMAKVSKLPEKVDEKQVDELLLTILEGSM